MNVEFAHTVGEDAGGPLEIWHAAVTTVFGGAEADIPPEDMQVNFEAGTAETDTILGGCGPVQLTINATGGESESEGHFTGPAGEESIREGVEKLAKDVTGIVCGYDLQDAEGKGGNIGVQDVKEVGF